ncbi:hypothetical protein J6G99_07960 [bacterium]|nr:hypothetical protein [bacterium]
MADKNFYTLEKTYPITMADHDLEYRLKPASLLNLLQDMGARNILDTPFGNRELNAQNLGWFLVRYRIEFDKYPQNLTEIKLYTENRGTQKQSAYRDFEAYTVDGTRLLRASSYWLMVDLNDKSLINIEEKFPDIKKYEKRDNDLTLRRLKPLKEWDKEKTFHVRYNDLDMNGHVNNIVYISWAVEALDFDFLKNKTPKNMDIYFKHDVKYGEDVVSYVKTDGNITEHTIRNVSTSEELCLIKIEWN